MAGVCRKVTSVCHQLARSTLPSMARTSRLSSMEGSTGWASVTVPNWRAKAACWSAVRDWSRKKMTWCVFRASRTAATTSGAIGSAMSTPEISAPMAGERGWTLREVARVTGQLCPSRIGVVDAAPGPSGHGHAGPAYIGRPPPRALPERAVHERRHRGPRPDPAGPQLLALVPVDDPAGRHDPRGPAARARPSGPPGLGGAAPGPPRRAPRARAPGGPARPRDARVRGLRRLP